MSVNPARHPAPSSFTIGLDLGQAHDFTAAAVVETVLIRQADGTRTPSYHLRHIQRLPLQTAYDKVAEITGAMVRELSADGGRVALVCDATGVGRPVIDLMRSRGLRPIGVTITGGKEEGTGGDYAHTVPKRNLVSGLVIGFQTGALRMAAELPAIELLRTELVNFKAKISASGNETFEAWRESIHDDLVLATALAIWYADRRFRNKLKITELRF